jgi:endonuclease YncB( thermonuclease family)
MRRLNRKIFLLFLGLLLLSLPLFSQANGPQSFTGKVVGVSDNATIKVMREGRAVTYGTKAKQYTSEMVFGNEVEVRIKTTDGYGRIVGEVILPDGSSLNKELVYVGLAW